MGSLSRFRNMSCILDVIVAERELAGSRPKRKNHTGARNISRPQRSQNESSHGSIQDKNCNDKEIKWYKKCLNP